MWPKIKCFSKGYLAGGPILPNLLRWQGLELYEYICALGALHLRQTWHLQDLGPIFHSPDFGAQNNLLVQTIKVAEGKTNPDPHRKRSGCQIEGAEETALGLDGEDRKARPEAGSLPVSGAGKDYAVALATRTAHTLNSGILAMGSQAGLVSILAAVSAK